MKRFSLMILGIFIGMNCTPWPSATMVLDLQGDKKESNFIFLLLASSQKQNSNPQNQEENTQLNNSNQPSQPLSSSPPEIGPYQNPNSQIYESIAIQPISPSYVTGNPTQCNITPALPSGLQIDPNTCIISGTPTQTSPTTTYTITPINEYGSGNSQTVTFEVTTGFSFFIPKLFYSKNSKIYQSIFKINSQRVIFSLHPNDTIKKVIPNTIFATKTIQYRVNAKNHG